MQGRIARLEQTYQGALGILLLDASIFCFSLQPDITDKHFQLPANTPEHPFYVCNIYLSPKHGMTYVISRPETPGLVDGHSFLEFHAGNDEEDTEGCTVLGETVGKLGKMRAILNSGNTFKRFMIYTHGVKSFPLTVQDCYK